MSGIPLIFVEAAAEKARDGMAIAAERVAPAINVCLRENIISIGLSDIVVTFGVNFGFLACDAPAPLVRYSSYLDKAKVAAGCSRLTVGIARKTCHHAKLN
ncbi:MULTISPECIES: hypothetical protein [unclassified Rhizobium]|uniref:hypothetical protein n=1 Tax=unclassified Rhizobium TaxID=2613769 RepID=UPI001FDEFDB6|nr:MULTISPECIES: hypothetical protein [unclassified Rhizobium]